MKHPHEEFCKTAFDQLVQGIFPHSQIVWEEVTNDPPDWYMTIDAVRYAVEATTIIEYYESNGNALPSGSVSASLENFVKFIEKKAIKEGSLHGAYIITLCPIPNLSKNRKKMFMDFMKYICETRDLPDAEECFVKGWEHQGVSIRKLHNKQDYVAMGLIVDSKWESDARKELVQYIAKTLSLKAEKLRHVTDPIILLLLDRYNYSLRSDWISAINLCESRDQFEVIAHIRSFEGSEEPRTTVLFARSPNWIT